MNATPPLLNKIDLLPYLDFDMELARKTIAQIHPGMPVFDISSKTEEGLDAWIGWLVEQVKGKFRPVEVKAGLICFVGCVGEAACCRSYSCFFTRLIGLR